MLGYAMPAKKYISYQCIIFGYIMPVKNTFYCSDYCSETLSF